MRDLLWRAVARIVTIPAVTDWLIERAKRTPYTPITKRNGTAIYMTRLWLFNPYGKDANGEPTPARWPWLPSIRIHHIHLPDDEAHLHDHPFTARTIILRGWYFEELPLPPGWSADSRCLRHLNPGDTKRLLFGEYHRIHEVSSGGVWTLFFTWGHSGAWGFLVDGQKVPWRKYLGIGEGA